MTLLVITLIVAGILLLGAELIIIPGFGVAGILGIASLAASCWVAFAHISTTAGIIAIIANIILVIVSTLLILRSKTWKKLSLKTNITSKVDSAPEEKGVTPGEKGITLSRLAPGGKIQIGSEILEGFTRDAIIEADTNIMVSEIEDNKVFVKELSE
ncbi:MAG: nodulation efficiency protein D (NfeD) [Bacteroidales bacterium]|nr:nodulation efficiency protein D (NfeD) [Bacteroidales bacterium]